MLGGELSVAGIERGQDQPVGEVAEIAQNVAQRASADDVEVNDRDKLAVAVAPQFAAQLIEVNAVARIGFDNRFAEREIFDCQQLVEQVRIAAQLAQRVVAGGDQALDAATAIGIVGPRREGLAHGLPVAVAIVEQAAEIAGAAHEAGAEFKCELLLFTFVFDGIKLCTRIRLAGFRLIYRPVAGSRSPSILEFGAHRATGNERAR